LEKEETSKQNEENLVKKTCRELGITQKELAKRMGIAYRTINAWNSGKTDTPEWAIKMFDFFKMEVEYKSLKNKLIEVIKNDSEIIQSLHTK